VTAATLSAVAASHRRARRSYAELMPTRDELVDGGFVAILTLVALYGFRAAYGGVAYFVVGAAGLVVGVVLAHVTARAKQGFLVVVAITLCAGVLLSGGVLRDSAIGGVLPSLATLRGMGTAVIRGWKELLTTVHPVGTAENLLALPYLMGLVAGVGGYSLARRSKPTGTPVLVPVIVLALSILFGANQPTALFLQGAVFAGLAITWSSIRYGRRKESVVRAQGRWARPVTAMVVVVVAVAGSWVIGPHLPFADSHQRRVLHVNPPFDASAYPSPLGGFRRYTKNASQSLNATQLLTVQGLPPGQSLRIAVLDQYDGVVWGAANGAAAGNDVGGFARVGSTIPAAVTGKSTAVQVSLGVGYSDVWLPDAGAVTAVEFHGTDASRLQSALRFNTATGTGLVPTGLTNGDTYTLRSIFRPDLTGAQLGVATPYGAPTASSTAYDFIKTAAVRLGAAGSTPMTRFLAIAGALQQGRYSDGQDSGDTEPGHGAGRLITFLGAKQLVGDDEQYAAAMALLANAVGVPARVVLGALPESDGSVTGNDVTAYVELELTGYGWVPIAADVYTPDRSKGPDPVQQQKPPKSAPQVVPPPLKLPPPPAVDPATQADSQAAQQHHAAPRRPTAKPLVPVPAAVTHIARYVGPPVVVILAWIALILAIKALRRRRRRTKGRATTRIAMGWIEILDCVRDLGGTANLRQTRREQARSLDSAAAVDLATLADRVIFSTGEPTEEDVHEFWVLVNRGRSDLKGSVGVGRRLRSALSLRSLRRGSSPAARTTAKDDEQKSRRVVVGADS
jgi:hypothetical protein